MGVWLLYAAGACAACSQMGNRNRPTEKVGVMQPIPLRRGGAAALPPSPISVIHTITHSRSTLAKEWGARGEGNAGR